MRKYAISQTYDLLRSLDAQLKQLKQSPRAEDAGAIHDVRVAIRRLRQCLRVFSKFYECDSWKALRRELAGLMQACGAVRDRDIAIGLIAEAGMEPDSTLIKRLRKERRAADLELRREVAHWKRHGVGKSFRAHLEV